VATDEQINETLKRANEEAAALKESLKTRETEASNAQQPDKWGEYS
jgi:hypothetical protein